jgi:outer membrane protein assembly factor BamB
LALIGQDAAEKSDRADVGERDISPDGAHDPCVRARAGALVALVLLVACGGAAEETTRTSVTGSDTTGVTQAPTTDNAVTTVAASAALAPIDGPYALALDTATGAERWRQPLPAGVVAGATSDDHVLSRSCAGTGDVGSADLMTGEVRWTSPLGCGAPTVEVLPAGDVAVSRSPEALVGFELASGVEAWRVLAEQPIGTAILTTSDAVAATVVDSRTVLLVDAATGAERWRTELDVDVGSLTIVAGMVVVGAWDFEQASGPLLVGLDGATGSEQWRTSTGQIGQPEPLAGLVVVPESSDPRMGRVIAFDAGTGEQRWQRERPDAQTLGAALTGGDAAVVVINWVDMVGPGIEVITEAGATAWELAGWQAVGLVDDVVIAGTAEGDVGAFDVSTGEARWTHEGLTMLAGAVGGAGVVVLGALGSPDAAPPPGAGTEGTEIEAVDAADGRSQWRAMVQLFVPPFGVALAGDIVGALGCTARVELVVTALRLDSGEDAWTWEGGRTCGENGPALAGAGAVLVASTGSGLTALAAGSGDVLYEVDLPEAAQQLAANEQVVIAVLGASLVAFDAATGQQRWTQPWTGVALAPPVIEGETLLFQRSQAPTGPTPSFAATLVAIDVATGQPRWEQPLDGVLVNAPAVLHDVVVGEVNRELVFDSSQPPPTGPVLPAPPVVIGFDLASGAEVWRMTGAGSSAGPSAADPSSGSFVVTWSDDNGEPGLTAIGADGAERWTSPRMGTIGAGAGRVLASSPEGSCSTLDAVSGTPGWTCGLPPMSALFTSDRVLLVRSFGGSH